MKEAGKVKIINMGTYKLLILSTESTSNGMRREIDIRELVTALCPNDPGTNVAYGTRNRPEKSWKVTGLT